MTKTSTARTRRAENHPNQSEVHPTTAPSTASALDGEMRAQMVMARVPIAAAMNTRLFTGGREVRASPFGSLGELSTDADMCELLIRTRWRRGIVPGRTD